MELCIALDSSDCFNDEYRAFVQVRDTSVPINDDALVDRKLDSMLPDHGYIACQLSQTGDYWTLCERDAMVGAGDSVLIVVRGNGMQRARAMLEGLSTPDSFSESRIRPLGRSIDIQVCIVSLPSACPTLSVRSGRILGPSSTDARTANPYEWVGGICVDGRSRKYLLQALPRSVKFGSAHCQLRELIGVGLRRMDWFGFRRLLDDLGDDAKYDLRFPGGMVAQMSIAVSSRVAAERKGFTPRKSGSFSPSLQSVSASDCAVVGFAEPPALVQALTTLELAAVIRSVRERRESELTESGDLWSRLEVSHVPSAIKRLVGAILKAR
jgi:hypothetical protein